jgi:hypothetical protein
MRVYWAERDRQECLSYLVAAKETAGAKIFWGSKADLRRRMGVRSSVATQGSRGAEGGLHSQSGSKLPHSKGLHFGNYLGALGSV